MSEYDDLIDAALENAQNDRKATQEAFDKLKPIFDIDKEESKTLEGLMLVGNSVVKILENLSRANEQIIKLAQLKQKDKSKLKDDDDAPFNIEDLKKKMKESKAG